MISRKTLRMVPIALMALALTGCSSKLKERITMLERANDNLTEQLNRCHSDLDDVAGERDETGRRLAMAQRDVDDLLAQLAALPEPEQAAPGWTAVPGGAMIAIEGEVLFTPGKETLRNSARRTLDAIVSAVQGEYNDKDVFVFGHTDDQPIKKSGWKDNWQLSAERSLAVVRYLKDRGVSTGRLVACGAGEHRPRVPNSSAPNRAKNRRVEIFAIDPQVLASR